MSLDPKSELEATLHEMETTPWAVSLLTVQVWANRLRASLGTPRLTGQELAEKHGIKVKPDQAAVDLLTGKRVDVEPLGTPAPAPTKDMVERFRDLQSKLCQIHCGEAANRGIHVDGCRDLINDIDALVPAPAPRGDAAPALREALEAIASQDGDDNEETVLRCIRIAVAALASAPLPAPKEESEAQVMLQALLEVERVYQPHKQELREAMREWAKHRTPNELIALIKANAPLPAPHKLGCTYYNVCSCGAIPAPLEA